MIKQFELSVKPDLINNKEWLYDTISGLTGYHKNEIDAIVPVKRSVDGRSKEPVFKLLVNVYVGESPASKRVFEYQPVESDKKAIIIGFGPAGMFAALKLIELGIKPIIFERGKDVQTRRRDLRRIQQENYVDPDSNYCFGEGGAGTYSDGKLYTRSTKKGDVKKILEVLVQHGATEDILVDSHPHIGSNKLPKIIKSIRETILSCNGEVHFNSRVTDFIIKDDKIKGIVVNNEQEYLADIVILATGHSARDIFYLLNKNDVLIETKPFALGVRIEHPQQLINEIRYHTKNKNENLPAASYTLAAQIEGRGVYSFCMCPGGIIVPAATAEGEIVVNGMSLSRRDSPFANSGFVVTVDEKDWKKYQDRSPFSAMLFQQEVEQHCYKLANNTQAAPAQRVTDFMENKLSASLNETSYIPGLTSAPLHKELPKQIVDALKLGLKEFNKKMRGYYTEQAQIVATESRTSSPIKIPRDKETMQHVQIEGLFPCGEGAGYAGGIVSAAIDGENVAEKVMQFISKV